MCAKLNEKLYKSYTLSLKKTETVLQGTYQDRCSLHGPGQMSYRDSHLAFPMEIRK